MTMNTAMGSLLSVIESLGENGFLVEIAILIIAAFLGGKLASLVRMPEVLGQILAGILVGPTVLGWIPAQDELIYTFSQIGVIFLMFLAGLDTDLKQLREAGKPATVIALGGVAVPLLLGTVIPLFVFREQVSHEEVSPFYSALYIGTILTATSVSISVSVLRDMGKLRTKQGVSILAAAIIDDVVGIILLAVVSGFATPSGTSTTIGLLLIKIVAFFAIALLAGFLISKFLTRIAATRQWSDKYISIVIVFCFVMAFMSELFSVAAITGAYFAGVILSTTPFKNKIIRRIQYIAYALFTPIFFVSIGIKANISADIFTHLGFSLTIVLIAILGKIVGCGLGAKVMKYSGKESLQVGVGMIARAEVALIVATQGLQRGIINDATFTSVVLLVVVSTIVTPPLLKLLFSREKPPLSGEETTAGVKS